jgi:hypothetical protein
MEKLSSIGCSNYQRETEHPLDFEEDLIVLSNELCSMPTERARGVVAHEIAHVLLGHTSEEHAKKEARDGREE